MRLVIQRVRSAAVTTSTGVAGEIRNGLLVLVGICQTDTKEHLDFCVRRLLRMKLFPKNAGPENTDWETLEPQWAQSCTESKYDILIVSQFTLHAKFKKPKPDFHSSMSPKPAREMYDHFVEEVRKGHKNGGKLATGEFGAMMRVQLENDGPVTMIVDSDLEMGTNQPPGTTGATAKVVQESAAQTTANGQHNSHTSTTSCTAAAGDAATPAPLRPEQETRPAAAAPAPTASSSDEQTAVLSVPN
ncbi:unnamed protein product [Amoebophrya sp. A120]|nr:unnamed protein product [Amoebophrya sp. A120]|eukprot:GSA120T00008169001.1